MDEKNIEITFEIKTTNNSKDSILNTLVLLLRDLKQFNDETYGCYEDYVRDNNFKIRQIQNELSSLYVN